MKLHDILSSRLPEIDDSVKECVNLGEWLLFKSEDSIGNPSSFYLKTDSKVYKLDDSGKLLRQVELSSEKIEIDEIFYFSDINRPASLSNTRLF